MKIELAGNELELMPSGAVAWPAERSVLVADVHLGKDQVFRRSGIAVPAGSLEADLGALDRLMEATGAERLVVLGDWVHAPPQIGDDWPEQVRRWRQRCSNLSIALVPGNHDCHSDRALSGWLDCWGIEEWLEPCSMGGLGLFHEIDLDRPAPGLSGHVHPVVHIRSGRERVRVPAFARRDEHLILPAFGRFTGGQDGLDRAGWQMFAAAGRRVIPVSAGARPRRT